MRTIGPNAGTIPSLIPETAITQFRWTGGVTLRTRRDSSHFALDPISESCVTGIARCATSYPNCLVPLRPHLFSWRALSWWDQRSNATDLLASGSGEHCRRGRGRNDDTAKTEPLWIRYQKASGCVWRSGRLLPVGRIDHRSLIFCGSLGRPRRLCYLVRCMMHKS